MTPSQPIADVRALLDARLAASPDKIFLIWEPFEGEAATWSYAAFATRARRFAAGLHQRGVMSGDRIVIHLENCPEALIAWYGCALLGAVAVTTNTRSTPRELAYFISHAKACAAVTQPKFAHQVREAGPDLRWLAITDTDAGAAPGTTFLVKAKDRFDAVDGDPEAALLFSGHSLEPVGIQYTSGTTSRPKGVVWTHANAIWGAKVSAAHEGLTSQDIHLVTLPLFHTNAQCYSVLASLYVGATVVLQPRFSASRFWDVSVRHQCTWTSMVPFNLRALVTQPLPERHDYRLWGNAINAPPTDGLFGVTTIGWWGMTETVTHGVVGSLDGDNPPMSMGRASPFYQVDVIDEDGQATPEGQVGDLRIGGERGVSLFLAYLDDPQATAAAFDEQGRLITGDRVRVDGDGVLYFADRSKDMLKIGGENVAASEIEQVIQQVPGVMEAAVVGKPHPMLDEAPVAFVLTVAPDADLAERIARACREQLADFKQPVEIRLVGDLPRVTLGKVAKAELRQRLASEDASSVL